MDNWGIIAWIGERKSPRVRRLAPPSAFKALFAKGTVPGEDAENGTRRCAVLGGWRELTVQIGHDA